ncbi:MAG: GNAT family N-acetyltransferase [Nocardia sp.]|nr:GNAT family N-acetyltransferase [Nocardia sp.]
MPKSKGRKPKRSVTPRRATPRLTSSVVVAQEVAVGRYRVREARTREELAGFERWASIAGAGGPVLAAKLVSAHTDGILAQGLRDPETSFGMLMSAVTGGDLDAVVWARSIALVATLDGQVVGGAFVGPAAQFIADIAERHELGTTAVMGALLFTAKLHLVAVDDEHRGHGLGAALVRAAITAAYRGGAEILYGQYLTDDQGLAQFYLRQGFTPVAAGKPMDFSQWLDGFPGGPAPLAGETFFYRLLTTTSTPAAPDQPPGALRR